MRYFLILLRAEKKQKIKKAVRMRTKAEEGDKELKNVQECVQLAICAGVRGSWNCARIMLYLSRSSAEESTLRWFLVLS